MSENALTAGDGIETEKLHDDIENDPIERDALEQRRQATSPIPFRPTGSETLIERTLTKYLASIVDDPSVELSETRDSLLQRINAELGLENRGRKDSSSTSPPLTKLQVLDEITVVRVLLARHRIVKIDLTDGNGGADNGVLAIYEDFGPLEGLHNDSESRIMTLISELRPSFSDKGLESAFNRMRKHAPVLRRTIDPT